MTKPTVYHHKQTIIWLLWLIVAMFGFCFAMVPLYNVFCKVTGLNGKTNGRYRLNSALSIDANRLITVQFISTLHADLNWNFYPLTNSVTIHPGELKQVAFYAKNNTNRNIIGRAIPSISPGDMASFLHKTECFCFNQQLLHAKEVKIMPLIFFIDKAIPKQVKELTLSYTMFDTEEHNSQ